jgi:hypothetical protein
MKQMEAHVTKPRNAFIELEVASASNTCRLVKVSKIKVLFIRHIVQETSLA